MTQALRDPKIVANKTRAAIVEALNAAGGGHYGGALSVVDILHALYRSRTIECPTASGDKLILSKGHAAIALYAVLQVLGRYEFDLSRYGSHGAGMEGHPDMLTNPHLHFSTGSLGQGLAVGLGMSLALRDAGVHVWVILGDGECQEGQVWETAMLAARYQISNLHAVVDCNGAQECGWQHDPRIEQAPLPDGRDKWTAFGWRAEVIDGHDHAALDEWITGAARSSDKPSVALAQTRKGYGVRLFEAAPKKYHCKELSEAEIRQVRMDLQDG